MILGATPSFQKNAPFVPINLSYKPNNFICFGCRFKTISHMAPFTKHGINFAIAIKTEIRR